MTVLGAVVFGGFLALGVLWLLITAPDGDVDDAWGRPPQPERADWDDVPAGSWVLTHSSQQ